MCSSVDGVYSPSFRPVLARLVFTCFTGKGLKGLLVLAGEESGVSRVGDDSGCWAVAGEVSAVGVDRGCLLLSCTGEVLVGVRRPGQAWPCGTERERVIRGWWFVVSCLRSELLVLTCQEVFVPNVLHSDTSGTMAP